MRIVILPLVLSATAHADPRVEIGLALGGHAFSHDVELGVVDAADEPGPESGAMIGARLAVPILQRLAIEGEAMVIPTKDDVLGDHATVYGLRLHARLDLLTGKLRPFLVAGAGVHVLRSSSPQMSNDVDRAYHWGCGIRWALTDAIDLRLDARHLIVPDRTRDGATSDFEATAGITYRFGHAPQLARVERPPPPIVPPGDRDGDGLTDDVDKCPDEPEDKDGWEDADGCPDPDNDGDGIPDAADKCPNEPETKNGYQDEDGCPDQIITELAGIGFERDSAKLDLASTPLLDHAVQILTESPAMTVEISGHTSAEGDADRNLDLSLRRAEAVKAYLVAHGVAAARLTTVGHGADKPKADNTTEDGRKQNRRIEFRIMRPRAEP